MEGEKLARMANQIGAFFEAEPDRSDAIEGVTSHLRRFWEPRMRRDLYRLLDTGGDGLSPLVREAITRNRERLCPPTER